MAQNLKLPLSSTPVGTLNLSDYEGLRLIISPLSERRPYAESQLAKFLALKLLCHQNDTVSKTTELGSA